MEENISPLSFDKTKSSVHQFLNCTFWHCANLQNKKLVPAALSSREKSPIKRLHHTRVQSNNNCGGKQNATFSQQAISSAQPFRECPSGSHKLRPRTPKKARTPKKVSRNSHLLRHHTPQHSRIHSGVNGGPDQPRANRRPKVRDFALLEQLAAMRVSVSSSPYFLKKSRHNGKTSSEGCATWRQEHVRNPWCVTAAGGSRWLRAVSHWR